MKKRTTKPTIVFLSTFPPQECGIATFSYDLTKAFQGLFGETTRAEILAISPTPETYHYPKSVHGKIIRDSLETYLDAAEILNGRDEVELVCIQHEYGIFGGKAGNYLIKFLENLRKPVVITLHTILPDPSPFILETTLNIATHSSMIVVMTERSKQILIEFYKISPEKVAVIPHGIHATPFTLPEGHKKKFNLEHQTVISTFGFLSRNKGIEYVISAIPTLLRLKPNLRYLIIGTTHPEIKKREGESYRHKLEQQVSELGLSQNVKFINRYLKLSELLSYLSATDVYVATSLDPNQAVSGTFSSALGAGRPVVSTSFAQAISEITPEVGRLVEFRQPEDFAGKIAEIISDPELKNNMSRMAFTKTRHQTWENVALSYMKTFARQIPDLTRTSASLPPIKLTHLTKMTDRFGIFQFAYLNQPNPAYGYTADDNARALRVVLMAYRFSPKPSTLRLANTYLKMLEQSFDPRTSTFINYFTANRKPDNSLNNKENLEDTNGRVLRALFLTASEPTLPCDLKKRALALIEKRLSTGTTFTHLRALAFFTIGLCVYYEKTQDLKIKTIVKSNCDKLLLHYSQHGSSEWNWFEPHLTYSNSILAEALFYGYRVTGDGNYFKTASQTLEFLISHTFIERYYMPIGQNGWFFRGGERSYFDQQPEDVSAMVKTLKIAYETTGKNRYFNLMRQAFHWFLGENSLNRFMYDCATGGCYDGLEENGVNLNQGAESTISYLLARLTMEESRNTNLKDFATKTVKQA